jgi:NAD-dependent dihydropyrimidine dehydrogenase PreA subunit
MAEWWKDALQTAFRLLPWPTETGLRRAGDPGRASPVLVTANYDYTVRLLLRALRGLDAWIVVAPASGINVWCAAAGGHFTTHQVVTALKTSGVADRVDHREVVLPQLAATGVDGLGVHRRTGWRVRFGPVRAEDLPEYLHRAGEKTDAMRRVTFGGRERFDMAVMWAAPASLIVGLGAAILRPAWALPGVALVCAMAAAVFFAFDRLGKRRRSVLAVGSVVGSVGWVALAGGGPGALAATALASVALTGLLTFDYAGSTPLEGGSHFDGRGWRIRLDLERCAGIYRCWEVCPEACFEKREGERKVALAHDERCVRCGACIVQCPQDALFFEDAGDGTGPSRRIEPDTIRRYKLNLMGRRSVEVSASGRDEG